VAVRRAEIAGAGLAGLTAAAMLAQRGWSVRVHEKGRELREIGAGIFLWDNAILALEAIGAYEELDERWEHVDRHDLRDHRDRLLQSAWMMAHGRLRVVVRSDLHSALARAAERSGVEIVTNSYVTGARPDGTLTLADGSEARADLVVGADGVFSRVRDSLGMARKIIDLEDGCGRHLIERLPSDPVRQTLEVWSGGRRLGVAPAHREKVYIFLCCPAADLAAARQNPFDPSVWLRTYPDYRSQLERIPTHPDGRFATFHEVHLHRWSNGRVALIGDAAHAMAPNLGQGACTAMSTSLALGQVLGEPDADVEAALRRWEAGERPIVDQAQRYSRLYGTIGTRWPGGRATLDLRSALIWGMGRSKTLQGNLNAAAAHVPQLA
jgi:2-polyprenyl-6-methoxyphenol hydroxylase-like FAD-dependent oxidoreductase